MNTASNTTLRRNRTICMHVCQAQYYMIIQNATQFRIVVDMAITEYPELFPAEKTYIATTVGNGCILGANISESASEEDLQEAYSVFKEEAECVNPAYQPDTVNTDGWLATQNSWKKLFPGITVLS